VDATAPTTPTTARRYESRPGRPALVAAALDELHGPTGGVAVLPHRLRWQDEDLRTVDLDDPYQLRRVYEVVLREAVRHDELRAWLDGATLRAVWGELHLPRGVRQAWEDRHADLAAR
jgi:hypothetical protein